MTCERSTRDQRALSASSGRPALSAFVAVRYASRLSSVTMPALLRGLVELAVGRRRMAAGPAALSWEQALAVIARRVVDDVHRAPRARLALLQRRLADHLHGMEAR